MIFAIKGGGVQFVLKTFLIMPKRVLYVVWALYYIIFRQ